MADGGPAQDPLGPLRIARFQAQTSALGLGRRAVIWFQGCSLACPGCIAASMNAAPPVLLTTARLLADWVLAIDGLDGLTLSGGDPFDQPLPALAEFLETVRSESVLGVMVYTGRTLRQWESHDDPAAARCLRAIDVLIDGPYVDQLNDGVGWRGSSNQVVHRLGSRPAGADVAETAPRRLELRVAADGVVSLTGLPARGNGAAMADWLAAAAGDTGVKQQRAGGEVA